MYLSAISLGSAVPRTEFNAVVHSAFRAAVNLRPAGDNHLLTLFSAPEGDLPQGIRVKPTSFVFGGIPTGIRASCHDGILSLEGYPLITDLRIAKRWESSLPNLRTDMSDPRVIGAWECAWEALNETQRRRGSEVVAGDLLDKSAQRRPVWVSQMAQAARQLLVSTAHCDTSTMHVLEILIGLGNGLTPSGDDFLAGYLIGLWCTKGASEARLCFLRTVGNAVTRLSSRTTDISRTYLFHAVHGRASSQIVNLAIAICGGATDAGVLKCTRAATQLGHTSGMDAVTGLLLGLAAWEQLDMPPSKRRHIGSRELIPAG